jgi:hypothetical protein
MPQDEYGRLKELMSEYVRVSLKNGEVHWGKLSGLWPDENTAGSWSKIKVGASDGQSSCFFYAIDVDSVAKTSPPPITS